ncbi:MAG: ATP-binding cassette domain-containing protein, partial [bacterium]|nr:ATP-binding cassette domain-containing protein [bacterium]
MEKLLQVEKIQVYYGKIAALNSLSLYIEPGEIVAIIGANGAGKTTLINTISGVLHPQKGFIKFKDEIISN